MIRVLFVCTGNICRSPTAEGVFRHLVRQAGLEGLIEADSAGTHGYHSGEPPDPRSILAARERGIDLSDLRARTVRPADFAAFDYVLAMDRGHLAHLRRMAPPAPAATVALFLDYAPAAPRREVPDPYYGDGPGFLEVLDLCGLGARGLLDHIRRERLAQ
ncbi:low molecular weight protein-tyrosine-phosphatase [Azospirillum thermophilum]|uniref:protein-tyrosine-phosphatase n=1 Tax=Azospirillum thermophilum TaxID=2202148 RepID=A0A2S2CTD5_9PROT|nr:low molecular weight protein-tyrosine-phosphatase [Azospirillum thermophilum]AWK87793.1 phosphotyrosine protein phosphatase [Azospirillum thermophilum]